jgi:hypothetical protein
VTDHRSASRERTWKLVSTLSGVLGAMVAKRLMRAGYHAIRRDTEPTANPFDRTDARFSWPDALLWAAAAGVGLGVTKVVSARLAAYGWEVATGAAPPSLD